MMNHRLTASILLTLLAAPCLWATTAAANAPAHPAGYNDSGVELNRTRQYLERQRIARKIQEGRNTQPVEGAEGPEEAQKGAVHFLLKQVELPESQVLSREELQKITGAYEGKDATLDDLYALVGKINALYQEKRLSDLPGLPGTPDHPGRPGQDRPGGREERPGGSHRQPEHPGEIHYGPAPHRTRPDFLHCTD